MSISDIIRAYESSLPLSADEHHITMIGHDATRQWLLLKHTGELLPKLVKVETQIPRVGLDLTYFTTSRWTISSLDVDESARMYYGFYDVYIRANADAILYLTDTANADSWTSPPDRFERFFLQEGTRNSVLLVLVDGDIKTEEKSEQSSASVATIRERIQDILTKHGRGQQTFNVLPVNVETAAGAMEAMKWMEAEIHSKKGTQGEFTSVFNSQPPTSVWSKVTSLFSSG